MVEGEPLLMSCNSSHRARLVETCWFHNGRLVPATKDFYSLHGALSILQPSVSDSGSWHCQLRYSDNVVVSATHDLQILGKLSLDVATPAPPGCFLWCGHWPTPAASACQLSSCPRFIGGALSNHRWKEHFSIVLFLTQVSMAQPTLWFMLQLALQPICHAP